MVSAENVKVEVDIQALKKKIAATTPMYKNVSPSGCERFVNSIGNTILADLSALSPNPNVKIYAKCEFMNPTYSIKDRIAKHIFTVAEQEGRLKPGDTVIAASSGNTGASIAMFSAMKGYRCIITTNTKCSSEKCDVIKGFGGELIVTACGVSPDSPEHYMNLADIMAEKEGYFNVEQYDNPLNPDAYYCTLGPEIYNQTNGEVTHFIAAGSTGGTISGTGKYLKEQNPNVKIVMADPVGSIFYDYWKDETLVKPKSFEVEGVGKDTIPGALSLEIVDHMIRVNDKEAFQMCRTLSSTEALLVGGSSGLNVAAAVKLAAELTEPAVIVTVLCDSGLKYLSKIYNDDWMKEKNFM